MSVFNQTTVPLVGVGGNGPEYVFTVVAGVGTTIPATVSGNFLTVDASALEPGIYSVALQIAQGAISTTQNITVEVLDQTQFAILNRNVSYQPNSFPALTSIPLAAIGGNGTLVWTLVPTVTTLSSAVVGGSTLSFSLTSFGDWTVGVRATDSLGRTVTQVLDISVAYSQVVAVVDGHVLLKVAANDTQLGAHQFTLAVADSNTSLSKQSFNYLVNPAISAVEVSETAINHFWAPGDTTTVVYPIAGDLVGFTLGATGPLIATNGLSVTIDTTTNSLIATGPPTSYGNAELEVPIVILNGPTQVATITQDFTLVSHGSAGLGSMTCSTRPYIVGETVGLDPLRPYFNAPTIVKDQSYTVRMGLNSPLATLPLGLSLDSVTGLVYGIVLAADVPQSVLEYVDASGVVQGTVTIVWDIVQSSFQLIDGLAIGQLQAAYSSSIATSSAALLSSVSIHRGVLPTGLVFALSTDLKSVVLSGAPTSAGCFDIWIEVTNANAQQAYLQKRLVIEYIPPLVILTDELQRLVTNTAFTQTLNAFGGVQPYTWSIINGQLPAGIVLNAASGVLAGTTTVSAYSQNLTVQVMDARGVAVTSVLTFAVNDALTITTLALPLIYTGEFYRFQMSAEGGQGAYTWALATASPALPGGLTLAANGFLSGATSLSSYTANVILQVTDAAANQTAQAFQLQIGLATQIYIDTSGIGPLVRGSSYNGTLAVEGPSVAPYSWAVIAAGPNLLPAGLTLTGDQANSGATATISGSTKGVLLNYLVEVQVVDANGNVAFAFVPLNTYSTLAITTAALPQATVGGAYSFALACSGVNSPFVWTLDASSPALPAGMSLTAAGVLMGTPSTASDVVPVFRVTDVLGEFTTKPLEFIAKASTLAITTTSLATYTAGVNGANTLVASGGVPPYSWSVSPSSANLLPVGLLLNAASGTITGKPAAVVLPEPITFRVTDAIGVYREMPFTLSVITNIKLIAGPDYIQGTNFGSLGIIPVGANTAGIAPHPNYSFMVVMTNLVSTSQAGLGFHFPAGYGANVLSYTAPTAPSYANGTAIVQITNPAGSGFGSGTIGLNYFTFNMSDSGIQVSATFTWTVYAQANIALVRDNLVPLPAALPLLAGTSGWIDISNVPGGTGYAFPPLPGGGAVNYAAAAGNLLSFSGVPSNLFSIGPNPTNDGYRLTYNGGDPPANTAQSTITVYNNEIAWWNAAANNGDFFTATSTGGGSQASLVIDWLVEDLAGHQNDTLVTGWNGILGWTNQCVYILGSEEHPNGYILGGKTYTFTVTMPIPLPPIQSNIDIKFTMNNGASVIGYEKILNSYGFLTGWTVSFTSPPAGTADTPELKYGFPSTCNVFISASDTLTFLQNGSIVGPQTVTYLLNTPGYPYFVLGWLGFYNS